MSFDERMDRLAERQQALTESVELLTKDVHDMQATMQTMLSAMNNMQIASAVADAKERTLRLALLRGVNEFLRGMAGNGEAE
jgi:hypothetical protein